jgi:hypothetical protein
LVLRKSLVMMVFVGGRGSGKCRGNTQDPDQFAHGAPRWESSGRIEAGSSGGVKRRRG